jgi:hypothetical protein
MNRVTLVALSWCLAIPGLSSAAERPVDNGAAQKGAIADMRNIGTAMMAWLVDQVSEAPRPAHLRSLPTMRSSPSTGRPVRGSRSRNSKPFSCLST